MSFKNQYFIAVYIINDEYYDVNDSDIKNIIFRNSITSTTHNFNIQHIYIYTHTQYIDNLKLFLHDLNCMIIGVKTLPNKINVTQQFLKKNYNILLLNYNVVFNTNGDVHIKQTMDLNSATEFQSINTLSNIKKLDELNTNKMYASICAIDCAGELSQQIYTKYGINYFIDTSLIVFLYSNPNIEFIDKCVEMSNKINSVNIQFVEQLSLTISNNDNFIFSEFSNTTVIQLDYSTRNYILEWLSKKINIFNLPNNFMYQHNYLQPYPHRINCAKTNENYYYYPCLDIVLGDFYHIINESPLSFNTNMYANTDQSSKCIYSNLFYRFNNKLSGVFIKHIDYNKNIPKIFHHLWLDDTPVANNWKAICKTHWEYRVWTIQEIRLELFAPNANGLNRWEQLFNLQSNARIKIMIASFAILEKYGGIVIDGDCVPLKKIPLNILNADFMTSFLDESKYGTRISYRVMASVRYGQVLNNIYNLFSSEKLNDLNNLVLNSDNVTILPSYYFNNTFDYLPLKYKKQAICNVIWKSDVIELTENSANYTTKSQLTSQRKNITQNIMYTLRSNPVDKIINNR